MGKNCICIICNLKDILKEENLKVGWMARQASQGLGSHSLCSSLNA